MSIPLVCFVLYRGSFAHPSGDSEKRKQEAERIRQKYPDRIPVSIRPL